MREIVKGRAQSLQDRGMKKPVKLSLLRDERKHTNAKSIRSDMFTSMREITHEAGDDIAGYAIVIWDKEGAKPTFAGDALTQHVAVDIATGRR